MPVTIPRISINSTLRDSQCGVLKVARHDGKFDNPRFPVREEILVQADIVQRYALMLALNLIVRPLGNGSPEEVAQARAQSVDEIMKDFYNEMRPTITNGIDLGIGELDAQISHYVMHPLLMAKDVEMNEAQRKDSAAQMPFFYQGGKMVDGEFVPNALPAKPAHAVNHEGMLALPTADVTKAF